MKWLLLSLLLLGSSPLWADEGGWSAEQNGLQARVFISPRSYPQPADWSYDVMIEFRNVWETSNGGVGEVKFRFSRSQCAFSLMDSVGHLLPLDPSPAASEFERSWDLVLPPGGRISFPIGEGGGVPSKYAGPQDLGKLLRMNFFNEWVVPAGNGPVQLSVVFSAPSLAPHVEDTPGVKVIISSPIGSQKSPYPPYHGWRGTLKLPPVDVPLN